VLAGLVLLVIAAVAIAPRLLDRPRMAAQIQEKLSHAVGGEVRWEEFSVRLLPAPHGVLRGLSVKTAAATFTTEEVKASLALWPLLTGSAEITSLRIARPVLSLTIVPAAAVPEEARVAPTLGPLQSYRAAMSAIVNALRDFAPDTVVAVTDADVNVHVEGLPPIEVKNFTLNARTDEKGVALDASAMSPYWNAMKLTGRIEYADLSSAAELDLRRIQGQAWLDWLLRDTGWSVAIADVDLHARFRGNADKALELDADGNAATLALTHGADRLVASPLVLQAKLVADDAGAAINLSKLAAGATSLADGVLRYSRKDGAMAADVGFRLDLAQATGYGRQLAPQALARVESTSGALPGRLSAALAGDDRRLRVSIERSDAAVQVKDLPGPIRLTRAAVDLDARSVRAENVTLSLPVGELTVAKARYALKDGAAAANAVFDLDVAQTLALVRSVLPQESRASLDIVESVTGRLRGNAKGEFSGNAWSAALQIPQSDAQAKLKPLPAPVSLGGLAVRATPKTVTVERAAVKFLDTAVIAAATISDFKAPRIRASVSEATIGPKALAWAWQTAQIPANFEPKAPIRLTVPHFAWAPKSPLELRADARFDSGPTVGVDVAWSPEVLDVRRAHIADKRSDVTVVLRSRGRVIEGSYAGTLDSRTIAAMLKSATAPAGALNGDLRFVVDRDDRQRSSVEGTLKGEKVDLSWLAGAPASVERLDLSADGGTLRIAEASVNWAGQRATLRGEVKRSAKGPVVQATIDSDGVLVDALLPKQAAKPAAKEEKAAKEDKAPAKEAKVPNIWPLPVTGKIAVRSKLVQYDNYKVQPLVANIVLEEQRAVLDVDEAFLCGLALPLTIEATPKGLAVTAEVAAQQQKLEETAHCLSGEKVLLTGTMNLRVDVRTQGQPADLLKNLKGTVSTDVRDGQVMKFALIGNILSMKNVVAMMGQGGANLAGEGFAFRQLAAKGRFDKGRFMLDEGLFRSNALGLGANGWISLSDFQTSLTVLVAPLALLNEAVSKVPIIGYVAGGALTSIPIAVNGDIRDPLVVPLGPRAITSELKGIFERTLSLPSQLIPGESKP